MNRAPRAFVPNPGGLCLCGCGERTQIATYTCQRDGYVKGEPKRYIAGHNSGSLKTDKYAHLTRAQLVARILELEGTE